MPKIIIVEKNGNLQSMNIKTFVESDLFKKAGFKTPTNFDCQTIWNLEATSSSGENKNIKKYSIELYAKNAGRANQENKYEFPPPVDSSLFFGSCVLINRDSTDSTKLHDLEVSEWKMIYDKLYGGFEDLTTMNSEDEDETLEIQEELEAAKNNKLTKTGYLDDGFVVEDEDEDDEDDLDSQDENIIISNEKKVTNKKICEKPVLKRSRKEDVFGEDTKLTFLAEASPKPKMNFSKRNVEKLSIHPEVSIQVISSSSASTSSPLTLNTNVLHVKESKNEKKPTKPKASKKTKKTDKPLEEEVKNECNIYLNCENELMEEEYDF